MCGWGGHHSAASCPCSARELVSPLRSRRLKMKNQQNTARFDHAHTLAACAALQLLNLAGVFVIISSCLGMGVVDSSLAPPPHLRMAQTCGRKGATQRHYNTHHMSLAAARATRRPLGEAMLTKTAYLCIYVRPSCFMHAWLHVGKHVSYYTSVDLCISMHRS